MEAAHEGETMFDAVRITVNVSQGRKSVKGWAKYSYGIEEDQIVDIERLGSDGYHTTYRVQYKKETA